MKGYFYARLISHRVNFYVYQKLTNLHHFCNLFSGLYSQSKFSLFVTLLINRLHSQAIAFKSLHLTSRCKRVTPFLLLSSVACKYWKDRGISEDEIRQSVSDFSKLFSNNNDSFSTSDGDDDDQQDKESYTDEHHDDDNCKVNCDKIRKELATNGWEPIILRDSFQVWRREVDNGLYQYRVFGTFTDVPAQAFFAVQRDLEYRKTWDHLVIKLEVIDKESDYINVRKTDQLIDYGNEVIHWIMHYPFPMYSREYCFIRRAIIDYKNRLMVLVSRAVDHPDCPAQNKYVRVDDYESSMVIQPHTTFEENGFDYLLTYFDNPRAAFPNPAYNWMAASGVPNFLESLHKAALQLNNKKERRTINAENSKNSNNSFNDLYFSLNRHQQENN